MGQQPRKKAVADSGHGGDIDLKPFINFLVVLIPVLMLSAEFAKISTIDIKLPASGRGTQIDSTQTKRPDTDDADKLLLTMIITDSVVTIGAKNGFMPSLFYKEYQKYVSKEDRKNELTVALDPKDPDKPIINPKTGKPFSANERQEIMLYVTDENYNVQNCLYTKEKKMLSNEAGNPVQSVNAGDTVYVVTNPRHMIIVKNPADFQLLPLSAYDEMKNRLMKIKERYKEASDADEIILAAENQVVYDKIIQLMDIAREADFPKISIAKLRG